jgi:hypothetical protein
MKCAKALSRGRVLEGRVNNTAKAAKASDRVIWLQESEACKERRRGLLHAACCIRHIREDSHRSLLISVH